MNLIQILGFKYDLTNKISHSVILEYVLKDYEITDSSASDSIKKLEGNNADIILENTINYYDLDSFIRPSKGTLQHFQISYLLQQMIDNGYIKNIVSFSKYYPYKKLNIFSFRAKVGNIAFTTK